MNTRDRERATMGTDKLAKVVEHTRRTVRRQDVMELTDGQLVACFVGRCDEAAFEALVRRHGPMVLDVCRRVAGNLHDAEDAFQATFLVLARKAAVVMPSEAVGNWLYGVAYRTALKARAVAARRRARERPVQDVAQPDAEPPEYRRELQRLLDGELRRLPEKYRLPIVLCDLEGRPRRAVARQLGLPDGTLSNRLASGRHLLARRLARHGFFVAAGALLLPAPAPASLSLPLLLGTVRAGSLVAAGAAARAVVSAEVATLMQGEVQSMTSRTLKLIAGAVLVITLAGLAQSGGPAVAPAPIAQPPPPQAPPPQAPPPQEPGAGAPQAVPLGFSAWSNTQAIVERDGDNALRLRVQMPLGRFIKLLDADGKPVHVHEMVNWQPPPFSVKLAEVRVYDTRGRAQAAPQWAKGLKGATLVLLEFQDVVDARQLAEAFRLYREDLHVLVLPAATFTALDSSNAFAPARPLPQTFPGAKPGSAIPPPKGPGQ
jgi:RNA polymerase sigma factor (sigma-70 family)